MMERLNKTTMDFVELLAEFSKFEMNEQDLRPYKDIIENMSYVLPYSKEQLVNEFNKHLKD